MNLFEYVKQQVTLLDVVREYVALKPAGTYWKGFSPFKHEKTASFTVSPHKGIYYCFSTGNGGDVIDFVSKMENCSPLEAVDHLVKRYGIDVPVEIRGAGSSEKSGVSTATHVAVCTLFAQWCTQQLPKHDHAQKYIQERGISQAMVAKYMLGYCPSSKYVEPFLAYARQNGILTDEALRAHVVAEGKYGVYFPFEERIIFPIHNHMGAICGFGGRVFKPGDDRPKYYNSQDHEKFNKKQILFGFYAAKKAIQTTGFAYLVEGYTDCIAMVQAGYENCVATLGTACTGEHLVTLARHAKQLFVAYDGDEAGQNAIMRLAGLCWEYNLELFVLRFPSAEDPASYLAAHKTIDPVKEQALPLLQFFIQRTTHNFFTKSVQEKLASIRSILELLQTLHDPLQQDLLMQQVAIACDMSYTVVRQEFLAVRHRAPVNGLGGTLGSSGTSGAFPVSGNSGERLTLEKKIFSVILNLNGGISNTEDEDFLIRYLTEPYSSLLRLWRESGYDFDAFFASLTPEQQPVVSGAVCVGGGGEKSEVQFASLLAQVQQKQWKIMVNDVKMRLAQAERSTATTQQILAEFNVLKAYLIRRGMV